MMPCYQCKHSHTIPGDCHLSCHHPIVEENGTALTLIGCITIGEYPLNITIDEHGFNSGWAYWPLNFDPVWISGCIGYEKS